ncbi:hypothetical protein [Methylomicrobium lacus]|uniref:hypothetical protein n=1 Tax=Methylomicrobium lacus TaxID=136992 RepID=UPI000A05FDD7|nr:hypothetical protein [Methylomicrobium lacus]
MRRWVSDPHSGGLKIPKNIQEHIKRRILVYAEANYSGKYTRLDIRFRSQFCYIDAYVEPYVADDFHPLGFPETREEYVERLRNSPIHLCRLRYFGNEESWSFAFYTYSNEKYEPCVLNNGSFYGTPEEAFETASVYLQD